MADNVGYTPGAGATISTDEIAGAHHQRVKLTLGNDGTDDGTVSSTNPMPITAYNPVPVTVPNGELIQAIEALRMTVNSLSRQVGWILPTTTGAVTVNATGTLAAVTSVVTVNTVTSLTGQTNLGGHSANEQIPALLRLAADSLRRNISVS